MIIHCKIHLTINQHKKYDWSSSSQYLTEPDHIPQFFISLSYRLKRKMQVSAICRKGKIKSAKIQQHSQTERLSGLSKLFAAAMFADLHIQMMALRRNVCGR